MTDNEEKEERLWFWLPKNPFDYLYEPLFYAIIGGVIIIWQLIVNL